MRRALPVMALLVLGACSAGDFGLAEATQDAGRPREMGPPACGEGLLRLGDGRCVEPPPADREGVCQWIATHALICTDLDEDCYVQDCEAPATAEVLDVIADCDDRRPDVWPGAEELCNQLDDDCDGRLDEDFVLGVGCDACGFEGKLECDVGDPRATVCDTAPGQSSADQGAEGTPELCDGLDQDCDGEIDEGCAAVPAAPDRAWPAVCGPDHLLWVEAGRVMEARADAGWAPTPRSAPEYEPAVAPSCSGSLAAWVQAGEGVACAVPEGGPWRCAGGHLVVSTAEQTYDLTGRADPGRPVVGADGVVWHDAGGAPVLNAHTVGEPGVAAVFDDGAALSDPTPWVEGELAARRWFPAGQGVALRDAEGREQTFDAGPARPGPPTLSARWLVWAVDDGAALWVVDRAQPEPVGYQITVDAGPHRRPTLLGDQVLWMTDGALRAFDLLTGAEVTLVTGLVDETAFAAGHGQVVWLEPDGRLRRAMWP